MSNNDLLKKIAEKMVTAWNERIADGSAELFDGFDDFADCWMDNEYDWLKSHPYKDDTIKIAKSKI